MEGRTDRVLKWLEKRAKEVHDPIADELEEVRKPLIEFLKKRENN